MRQLDLTERLLRLRGVPVFRGMSAVELTPLAAAMRSMRFEKGDVLLREDEPPHSFHMLVSGSVTMRRHGRKLRTITAPGGVGFLSLLARTGGGTDAIADERCETFAVSSDAIDEMFEDYFTVLLGTIRWLSERLIAENLVQTPPPYRPPEHRLDDLIGDRELGIVERIFLIHRARTFWGANVNSIARLVRQMKEERVPAGHVVWRPNARADGSIMIVKGMMDLSWNNGKTVQQVGPGYVVGGAESIANLPRWNELVTTEPAVFLRGSREALIDMFEDDLEAARSFMSMIAGVLLRLWDLKAEKEAQSSPKLPDAPDSDPDPASLERRPSA